MINLKQAHNKGLHWKNWSTRFFSKYEFCLNFKPQIWFLRDQFSHEANVIKNKTMRIAFDLDDTLIPTTKEFTAGSRSLSFPFNFFYKESLRNGAVELLKEIGAKHELWIYTTSLRSGFYVKSWLKIWGVNVKHVVNYNDHELAVKENHLYSRYSKAPILFNIDLLVDDSMGVKIECKKQGVNCFIIDPSEKNWVQAIRSKIFH